MIFINNNKIINQINPVPNFHFLFFIKTVINVVNIAANDTNNQTGYTDPNLFNSLCVVRGFTAKRLVLAFQIKLSPKARNTPNGIKDNVIEKNSMSTQTLLFSALFILEKNIIIDIAIPSSIHTKWK
jgi:hypothetical protein